MASLYPAALSHFAIFCPELGADEDNTHEQLLFYAAATLPAFYPYSANDYFTRSVHLRRRSSGSGSTTSTGHLAAKSPSTANATLNNSGVKARDDTTAATLGKERVVSLDMKLREIGLASALVSFAGTFTKGYRFHIVHSEKRRTVIFEPEKGILWQLSIVLPRSVRPFEKEKNAYSIEFLDSELSDEAIKHWILHEYWSYRLLFGPIRNRIHNSNRKQLVKRQLDLFFGNTLWHWDQRWDRRFNDELDLLHTLLPLPQLPVGAIILGGFDEFWRDLSAITMSSADPDAGQTNRDNDTSRDQPLVISAVVLWRGRELLWSSWLDGNDNDEDVQSDREDKVHALRALISWSRAVYAPAFSLAGTSDDNSTKGTNFKQQRPQTTRPHNFVQKRQQPLSIQHRIPSSQQPATAAAAAATTTTTTATTASNGGWSVPGTSWLWGWRKAEENNHPTQNITTTTTTTTQGNQRVEAHSIAQTGISESTESSGSESEGTGGGGGGLSQALSRAVNALVEPRPPTPPEVDPVFSQEIHAEPPIARAFGGSSNSDAVQQYTIPAEDIEAAFAAPSSMPFPRDSDSASLRSIGSMASVRTTKTTAAASVALTQHPISELHRSAGGRTRASTMQNGGPNSNPSSFGLSQSYMRNHVVSGLRRHSRTPSVVSNSTVGTVDSTQLRDDTRVSSRSWWSSWGWGIGGRSNGIPEEASSSSPNADIGKSFGAMQIASSIESDGMGEDYASGIDLSSTFLFTGESPFPGFPAQSSQAKCSRSTGDRRPSRPEHIRVDEEAQGASSEVGDEAGAGGAAGESGKRMETINQLGMAMEEELPAVYEHGIDVDLSRGVVLSPRAIPGMQYDTRLIKLMHGQQLSGAESTASSVADSPLFSELADHSSTPNGTIIGGANKTLAYKYGDMLFFVFGSSNSSAPAAATAASCQHQAGDNDDADNDNDSIASAASAARGRRRDRRRMKRQRQRAQRQSVVDKGSDEIGNSGACRFSANEAQAVEAAVLRYAESLQAAAKRDSREIESARKNEVRLAKQRRIPPYVHQEHGRRLTRTNWKHEGPLPLNHSYLGFVPSSTTLPSGDAAGDKNNRSGGRVKDNRGIHGVDDYYAGWSGLSTNVKRTLAIVSAEMAKNRDKDVAVCARMQDKGWIAGSGSSRGEAFDGDRSECYCVVNQPKATLADAQTFLAKISKRAAL